ncbi:outer membrane protein assembly factor BamE [Zavarzinia compransoris]|uniref:outer membrane protein assembly factor BamE n=1 Tax=Zavarzinia marina TaxID=2911065 RepID=UPI001F491DC0|nr:outer membrane protein assembly factor BamE [Zavarzinia marina]MCF4164485.1 outer membrane protein assembly factor BamE [Zavarzinia marina]
MAAKRFVPPKLTAAAVLTALALGACAPVIDERGWRPDDVAVSAIRPGVDNKESVARLLGTPSTVSNFDDSSWYYISATTERVAFERDAVTDQAVLIIDFDPAGNVTEVSRLDQEDGKQVAMNPDRTPTLGNELTIWQQLFGNLGRFNAPSGGSSSAPLPGGTIGRP